MCFEGYTSEAKAAPEAEAAELDKHQAPAPTADVHTLRGGARGMQAALVAGTLMTCE
jgi:hypothetical protein